MKASFNRITLLLIAICLNSAFGLNAQVSNTIDMEKIYTQTDRPFYFPGETLWFKSYVTKEDNTATSISDIMHVDLLSPKGDVAKSLKLPINEGGYAFGNINIGTDWVGGIYTLKVYTNWMRNYGEDASFIKKITIQKVVNPNALLTLDFEQEGYGPSSQVTAKFEAKDLKNNPLTNTNISYKVTIKGQPLLSKEAITNNDGKAILSFKLPKDLQTRDVVVNVLIQHKGSTESISRSVPVVLDNIDLQFFPESGKLLTSANNRVAFKAIDEFGKPVDVQGYVFDESGHQILSFDSFHDGMGTFQISPSSSQKYYAQIAKPFSSNKKIALPKVYGNGINFRVVTDSLNTRLNIHSTLKAPLYLEISNAQDTLLNKIIEADKKDVNINTSKFPIGITKFRLTNADQTYIAERLVFINAHKQLNITIELDKEIYQTREKVNVTITTTDRYKKPIPSNLSIAIADNKLLSFANDKQDHILSYLLMSSELKGKIHEPYFYFNPEKEKSSEAIDYVMLTHGWRDYLLKPLTIEHAQYKPEQLNIQTGRIVDKKGNPVRATLLLFDEYSNKVAVFESNEDGSFAFKFGKEKRLTLMAYTEDGKPLKIIDQSLKSGYANSPNAVYENNISKKEKNPSKFNNPALKTIKKKANANVSVSLKNDESKLDEVVVVAYGVSHSKSMSACVSFVTSEEVRSNETVAQFLQGRVTGLNIINANANSHIYGNRSVTIRGSGSISGNSEPLIIIDGMPYNQSNLSTMNPNDIESVAVLKNPAATSIYGSSGANGVIIITTKTQDYYRNWGKKKLNNAKFNNYAFKFFYNDQPIRFSYAKEFYIPKYEDRTPHEERNDFRQTIYWNPVVQTDENGKATLEFYNSDAITSFQVLAEGIGYNGLIGRKTKDYATKKLLNVDFKMPNYMVLKDTIALPVTITNDSDKMLDAKLDITLPNSLRLQKSFDKKVSLEAHSSIVKYIKVVPIAKAENATIELQLSTKDMLDKVKREATILSPYFPTEISISGTTSSTYDFSIEHLVNGSLQADFTIYTDIVGDVMDGIESIIREPYGCFEQVSSSTYPNILVLKYLKETNKSNPEIERRAMAFIEKGYKKLAAYETRKDGFEWYGKAPPHEALTAYGLMEFTEMKEVYNGVSEPMLKRTINYLLSRRDGRGGFKQNRGKYGFSAAPENVNNAYIVYAISESGIDADIKNEYDATLTEALKSNDSYRMALMTCASDNLKDHANTETLIDKIKTNIETHGFHGLPTEHTITRSYGNSKNIETVAFTLLALMRENKPDHFLISQGIEYLVSLRKHNRFGSTQATSMALKALIEYSKGQKAKIVQNNSEIVISINGNIIKEQLKVTKNGKIAISGLEAYLKKGKQTLGISFSNTDNTFPYSFNIAYETSLPESSIENPLEFNTEIADKPYHVGDNVSMSINVSNTKNEHLGMVTAIVGIPSGTTAQPWQLKNLLEEEKVAYYEIFDNYLVFYWRSFKANETKTIRLDLKADIAGNYQAPASAAYLYYGDEFKSWIPGNTLSINK